MNHSENFMGDLTQDKQLSHTIRSSGVLFCRLNPKMVNEISISQTYSLFFALCPPRPEYGLHCGGGDCRHRSSCYRRRRRILWKVSFLSILFIITSTLLSFSGFPGAFSELPRKPPGVAVATCV